MLRLSFAGFALSLLPATVLTAQSLTGTVTDAYDAALPAADVRVTGPNFDRSTSTDSGGRWLMSLPAGTYTVTVSVPGFATRTVRDIAVTGTGHEVTTALRYAPLNDEEIVVQGIADPASPRPGHLPGSEIAVGSRVNIDGVFPGNLSDLVLTATSSASPPVKFTLNIQSANEKQIVAVTPLEIPPGVYSLEAALGGLKSRPAKIGVVATRPSLYTSNDLGFGTALATHPDGSRVDYLNPARPGGEIGLLAANMGITVEGHSLFVGNQTVALGSDRITLNSDFPGTAAIRIIVPNDSLSGCSVPIGIWHSSSGPGPVGTAVSLPIAASGPCSDTLGFNEADWPALTGTGLPVFEATVTESTFVNAGTRRDFLLARLSGTNWLGRAYDPPAPPGSCTYRWLPEGFTVPNAPNRFTFGGAASMTLPCCQFNFTAATNNGPFSLAFAPASAYNNGNYSLAYSSTFTANNQPFTAQFSGTYTRQAGSAKALFADTVFRNSIRYDFLDRVIEQIAASSPSIPQDARESTWLDVSARGEDALGGVHTVRCIQPATENPAEAFGRYRQWFPEKLNRLDAVVRWFPRNQPRHEHTGGSGRTHVTFDASVTFQGLRGFSAP